jgi:hypothetical protein
VPELDRFVASHDDHAELMKFYSRARFGIVNRVHAGFMLASLENRLRSSGTTAELG